MLVHKKQEWIYEYGEQAVLPMPDQESRPEKTASKNIINKSLRLKCLWIGLAVTFLTAVVVMQSAHIVNSGYGLVNAKREIMRLERSNEMLRIDIAKMKTPERIAQVASQKMGMIMPQTAYFSSGSVYYAKSASEKAAAEEQGLAGMLNIALAGNKRFSQSY